jgi:hypothetical protein
MLATTRPVSHSESMWFVKWVRQNKQVPESQYDLKAFVRYNVGGIVAELKKNGTKITEEEVLIGLRRIMPG